MNAYCCLMQPKLFRAVVCLGVLSFCLCTLMLKLIGMCVFFSDVMFALLGSHRAWNVFCLNRTHCLALHVVPRSSFLPVHIDVRTHCNMFFRCYDGTFRVPASLELLFFIWGQRANSTFSLVPTNALGSVVCCVLLFGVVTSMSNLIGANNTSL